MRKTLTSVLLICLIAGIPKYLKSLHIIGGDMSYECLGNDDYLIKMNVYRDCQGQGAPFDFQAALTVYSGDDFNSPFVDLNVPIAFEETIPIDNSNPCLIPPSNVCVERGYYEFTVNLPYNAFGYHISYQRCCRNSLITNIANPNDFGATYTMFISGSALIPAGQTACVSQSGPSYNSLPPSVICANNNLDYDHSAFDADGDSLVYELCNPFEGGTNFQPVVDPAAPPPYSTIPFINPTYTFTQPLGPTANMQLDPVTGQMTAFPSTQGQFVVGVCVKEYRNGVLMSQSIRDFQFNVANCVQVVNVDIVEDELTNLPDPDNPNIFRDYYVINSCGDTVVNFIDESFDANFISSYYWEFKFNDTLFASSSLQNPTIIFPDTGSYYGTYIVNPDNPTCTDTGYILVNVFPELAADFGITYDSCAFAPVQFVDSSFTFGFNEIVGWEYNLIDSLSFLQNPTHFYDSTFSGDIPIHLTVTDDNGCQADTTKLLPYYPTPIIYIDADTFRGCAPFYIEFSNNSYPITGYTTMWILGDGDTSYAANPAHIYTDPGDYTVILEIRSPINDCVARDTFVDLVRVESVPVALYEAVFDTCSFDPINFVDMSIDTGTLSIISWEWDFGDNTDSSSTFSFDPIHTFDTAGIYDVRLVVRDSINCTDTIVKTYDYFPSPLIDIIPSVTEGCQFLPITFQNNSYPTFEYEVLWDFGDGDTSTVWSPTHTYQDTGVYTITLTIYSPRTGCATTEVFDDLITVWPNPRADFEIDYDTCSRDPVGFNDLSSPVGFGGNITEWFWDLGDGTLDSTQNVVHQYDTATIFTINYQIMDQYGCRDTISKDIHWYPSSDIQIDPTDTTGCRNLTLTFDNNSWPLDGYNIFWDFGDMNTNAVDYSPTHTYPNTGFYDVTISMVSPTGCPAQELYEDYIKVFVPPTADYFYEFDTCNVAPISFIDNSVAGDSAITGWFWQFDDGFTSADTSPIHQLDSAGFLDVSLIVTDQNTCMDTIVQTVGWFPNPILDIVPTIDFGCEPLEVYFENTSYPINGYTTVWEFGDGDTSHVASPTHVYTEPGIYTVIITITAPPGSPGNCISRDTFQDLIIVQASSTMAFASDADICSTDPVHFIDQSQEGNAPLHYWTWYFGDGDSSYVQNPYHQYDSAGIYNVTLEVVDSNGCKNTITQPYEYFPAANTNLQDDLQGCAPAGVTFNHYSVPWTEDYDILWQFGDGQSDTSELPVHTYLDPGSYTVTVTTTSPNGCTATSVIPEVKIDPPPLAGFEFDFDHCSLERLSFEDQSEPGGEILTDWIWSFGDTEISNLQNPTHLYDSIGTYDISLIVRDNNGCYDTTSVQTIEYYPAPELDVEPDDWDVCVPATVTFNNLSYPNEGYSVDWNFGDGYTSDDYSPTHTFETPGAYNVQLVMRSPTGCVSDTTLEQPILVGEPLEAQFLYSPERPSNFRKEVQFIDQSLNASEWEWTINEELFYDSDPVYIFPDTGFYQIQLVVTHEYGCVDTAIKIVEVLPLSSFFLPTAFSPNEDGVNEIYKGVGTLLGIRGFEMVIYNRWGELVFLSRDPEQGWNGRKNNTGDKVVKNGVYMCRVTFRDAKGNLQEFNQYVTVVR